MLKTMKTRDRRRLMLFAGASLCTVFVCASAQGVPAMSFVTIPAGQFMMGSREGEKNERPEHRVRISSFEFQDSEVTQAQWLSAMGTNPSYFKGENHPVDSVSWHDVQDFIARLNARGEQHLYRLPTEAEWEYAARAGAAPDTGEAAGTFGFHTGNSSLRSHPVRSLPSNAWGLFDMRGNVWEWSPIGTTSTPRASLSILEDPQKVSSASFAAADGTARRMRCARPSASPANLHSAIRLLAFVL
jgi:formylglycine-generating enzyme required for sulfatase activity